MFILSNIHDRNYKDIYPDIENVIYDISDKQLNNEKNKDWKKISIGSIVCVIKSSRKISTFYKVDKNTKTNIHDPVDGYAHVLIGKVIGKTIKDEDMEFLLNRFDVNHPYLPSNKFSIGFNVADIGGKLGDLAIKTKDGECFVKEIDVKQA